MITILIVLPFLTPALWGSNALVNGDGGGGNGGSGVGGGIISNINGGVGVGEGGGGGGISNSETITPLASRVVHTKYGAVSGIIVHLDGRNLDPVEAFKGLPYASPPVGSLRFMPPVTGALWSGVKKADRFGAVCPQRLPDLTNSTATLEKMPKGRLEYLRRLFPYLQNQSEDCLYLNIYAPIQVGSRESSSSSGGSGGSNNNNGNSDNSGNGGSNSNNDNSGPNKYPVMVFVHGESYEWNSGNPYDGSILASFGQILVVTINYRLGILGFLNANTDRYSRSPANYGLMDIIAALHWLQENIGAFGGDPRSVTLVGHGTGAACVHFLISSSAVPEGLLFHRAILMSGSGLAPWSLVSDPAYYAAIVSNHVKCSPDLPHSHLMKCLRDRSLDDLLSTPIHPPPFGNAFGPSVDGVVIDTDEIVTSDSGHYDYGVPTPKAASAYNQLNTLNTINSVLLRKTALSKLSRYDIMVGVTRAESYFAFNSEDVQYGIEADRRTKILRSYVRNTYSYHLNEILATIVNEYTDWERPVQHPINIRDETIDALSDAQYVAPAAQTADLHSADHRNSFLYVFDYQTKFGDFPQRQGCIHGEDLPYIFGAPLIGGYNQFPRNYTKSEISLSEAVMMYWSNFVRSGNPNELQEPEHGGRQERSRFKNIEWIPYESIHKKFLSLDNKPKLKNHYRAHRLSFWLNLVPDLHKPGTDDVPASHHQLEDDASDRYTIPTVKPLNPPLKKDTLTSNYSIFTTQMFSLLNLTSEVANKSSTKLSNSNLSNGQQKSISTSNIAGSGGSGNDIDTEELHQGNQQSSQEDGFAAYSTALSVTIAIGCSLLILNVLIFAGVYYQRDKTRLHEPRGIKKRSENGQMPNNICGELETLTIHSKNDPSTILGHHHALQHHQRPPPEFADIPQRAPPPPKHLKTMPDGQLHSSHTLQMIGTNCGGSGTTLQKKSCVKNSNNSNIGGGVGGGGGGGGGGGIIMTGGSMSCPNQMDELRV